MRASTLIHRVLRRELPSFLAAALVLLPQATEAQGRLKRAGGATLQVVAIDGVPLAGDVLQLSPGQRAQLELRAVDGGGGAVDLRSADIRWETSNPDLLQIEPDGYRAVVAAQGSGETMLRAVALGQTVTLRAAVGKTSRAIQQGPQVGAPAPPTGLIATATPLSVRLSWSPAAGANGYQVFRSNSTSGPWVGITPQVITDTSYTDRPVLPNTTFAYKVASVLTQSTDAPLVRASGTPVTVVTPVSSASMMDGPVLSTPGAPVSVATPVSSAAVTGISASGAGPFQLMVRWNAVEGAHHYFIAQPTRLACPPNSNYNTDGLSQLVSTTRWGANCVGPILVHPVYRLARFPTERDTTDWIGPGAFVGGP